MKNPSMDSNRSFPNQEFVKPQRKNTNAMARIKNKIEQKSKK